MKSYNYFRFYCFIDLIIYKPLAHRHNVFFSSALYIFTDFQFRRRAVVNVKFNWSYQTDWKPSVTEIHSNCCFCYFNDLWIRSRKKISFNFDSVWYFCVISIDSVSKLRSKLWWNYVLNKQMSLLIHSHDQEYFLSIYWIGWSHHFRWLT